MPRGTRLSLEEQSSASALSDAVFSVKKIAAQLGCSRCIIAAYLRDPDHYNIRNAQGRPHVLGNAVETNETMEAEGHGLRQCLPLIHPSSPRPFSGKARRAGIPLPAGQCKNSREQKYSGVPKLTHYPGAGLFTLQSRPKPHRESVGYPCPEGLRKQQAISDHKRVEICSRASLGRHRTRNPGKPCQQHAKSLVPVNQWTTWTNQL
ncbi:hypothetical protein OESDEN_04311, partial [Oesophagostomum dentatum]